MQVRRESSPRFYLLGESAVVIESSPPATLACQRRIWFLAARLADHPAVREVVPGMNNLSVLLRSSVDPKEFLPLMQRYWAQGGEQEPSPRPVEIPVHYGGEAGPDLQEVARHCGLSAREVIQRHARVTYTVYFLGFRPGFAYLGDLDPLIAAPRRAEPRVAVPAGSVGIGGTQTGIYPAATPGGWQIIGYTPLSLFDPGREPPTLLLPGDRVRFVPLGAHD
jgi:KipI family sensor histidine kinase inhibitor